MRNQIKDKLLLIDKNLYYGMIPDNIKIEEWNYLVFSQKKIKKLSNTDLPWYYSVTIVREDYIPDEIVFDVINKMEEIPGLKLADGDFGYDYTTKGNTDLVVEILSLDFVKSKKRC